MNKIKKMIGSYSEFDGFINFDIDSDIMIPNDFKRTTPRAEKMKICSDHYSERGIIDRPLVIEPEYGFLIDGYVGYLVAKKFGCKNTYGMYCDHKVKHMYVMGRFDNGAGCYIWEFDTTTQGFLNSRKGCHAVVDTMYGNQEIEVVKLLCTACEPLKRIKKVISF